ncbi:hypothetical protein Tco_1104314 [Tanacetum coccineum]
MKEQTYNKEQRTKTKTKNQLGTISTGCDGSLVVLNWKSCIKGFCRISVFAIYSVMSDSDESGVTHTEVSSPFEDLSDIGSPRADDHEFLELPYMPEDPYLEAALQAPPSPDYVPGPEEPEHAPPSPDYLPDYVPESNPEADPEEDDDEDPDEDPNTSCRRMR